MLFNTPYDRGQFGNDLIVKEVSSVANQLGKERVMSETYGASGWELDFEDQKKVADWQFALGVNFVCQHLVLYSLEGYRKRDFPLSFAEHQPWWHSYHLLGDYIGRLSYIMSQGKFVADILLLHPSSSTWVEYSPLIGDTRLEQIEHSVKNLCKKLSQIQYFYDLGDDILIGKYGKVIDNRINVGKMKYKTIIVPDMTVMRNSNFNLLKEFAKNGGHILVTGSTPELLDGEEDKELREFFNKEQVVNVTIDQLEEYLDNYQNKNINITDKNGKRPESIYCHQRDCEERQILFLANINKEESYDLRLNIDSNYQIEEWDIFTGEKNELTIQEKKDSYFLELSFQPVESHLLIVNQKEDGVIKENLPVVQKPKRVIELENWQVKRNDYNALTLNQCQVKLTDSNWSDKGNVNQLDDSLKDKIGIERGHIFAPQPWSYSEKEKKNTIKLKVKYTFNVQEKLTGDLYLAVESPDFWTVFVNGEKVIATDKYYKDRAFILHNIKDKFKVGENEVILKTNKYGVMLNIEAIYVVGDYKLNNTTQGFVLLNEDDSIGTGDWTEKGYPYYSGKMQYSSCFKLDKKGRVKYRQVKLMSIVSRVFVNGQEAGFLCWKPYQLDISDYVIKGKNKITVEVMNSLQNLLGPHDILEPEGLVSPGSFYSDRSIKFVKSGFNGQAEIVMY